MKRRSFLGGILACAAPPGFVRQGILMPVKPQGLPLTTEYDLLQPTLTEVVTYTPRKHAPTIAANIGLNNLLLQRIRKLRKDMEFGLLEEEMRAPTPR